MEASTTPNPSPLAALLSDPALLSTVKSLMAGAGGDAKDEKEENPAKAPPLPEGLSSLLSDPALLQKLPLLLSPLMEAAKQGAPTEAPHDEKSDTALPASLSLSAPAHTVSGRSRNDLLISLKPFLSRERCDAIDMIIKLSTLGSILGKML